MLVIHLTRNATIDRVTLCKLPIVRAVHLFKSPPNTAKFTTSHHHNLLPLWTLKESALAYGVPGEPFMRWSRIV